MLDFKTGEPIVGASINVTCEKNKSYFMVTDKDGSAFTEFPKCSDSLKIISIPPYYQKIETIINGNPNSNILIRVHEAIGIVKYIQTGEIYLYNINSISDKSIIFDSIENTIEYERN